jgi:hypothetical protein
MEVGRYVGDAAANGNRFRRFVRSHEEVSAKPSSFRPATERAESSG